MSPLLPRLALAALLCPATSMAATSAVSLAERPATLGVAILFALAYLLVILEEFTHMRKSLPVMLCAGLTWLWVALIWEGDPAELTLSVKHYLLEYAELLLFLLVAMIYVNAMLERGIFAALRVWLISQGFTYRTLFWLTGILAFFSSSVLDNMTTALIFAAVIISVGQGNTRFISLGAINIVVAANAGGAFCPFGDITTLMVWQKGLIGFWGFFALFIPSAISFLVPAFFMSRHVESTCPPALQHLNNPLKPGALGVPLLFMLTIAITVTFNSTLALPPFLGMMTGLALLKFYGYYLGTLPVMPHHSAEEKFDSFRFVAQAEWDTLLFFFGVVMSVGALSFVGYLELASHALYHDLGASTANILIGLISAVIDNIPLMVAVLHMDVQMDTGQWLLVTMTAGIGGSLLSIGSAAGVAMMGQAKGYYTFFSHLRWTWAIALGYAVGIACHFWLNRQLFNNIAL